MNITGGKKYPLKLTLNTFFYALYFTLINNLKEVYDPEMQGVSVYELGLIYDIDIDDKEGTVKLTHTLTSAWCPYADEIVHAIHKACEVDNVNSVNVITTFDPPFSMKMVPEETRLMLGW